MSGVPRHDEFRQTYAHARDIWADIAFGEQILDIADYGRNDWGEAKNDGAPRQTWGDKQTIDIKNDWSLRTEGGAAPGG